MKIYIQPNFEKPDAKKCTILAIETLNRVAKRRGEQVEILFGESDREYIGGNVSTVFIDPVQATHACDIIMPIGGDGTIMRAAHRAAKAGKPILGVNAGYIGFLTQAEAHELDELERLFSGNYKITERMMLSAKMETEEGDEEHEAINDVVIRHGDADRIVDIEVWQDEKQVVSHRADGIIFSTPTGSTAYSMSAGGPIVSPELSLILMTAICPHSAFNCSLVLPPEYAYTIRENISRGSHGMYVSVDGVRIGKLKPGGNVTVSRSATVARFIDLGLREFYSNLNQKLSWRR